MSDNQQTAADNAPLLDSNPTATAAADATAARPARKSTVVKAEASETGSKSQPIILARWNFSETVAARHSISPEASVPYEDVLKPQFFANIAVRLRPTDIVEVRPEDNSYYAELYVWSVSKAAAVVSEIVRIDIPKDASFKVVEGFEVEFRPGPKKFRIVRVSDSREIQSGFDTADAASEWLIANRRQFAA